MKNVSEIMLKKAIIIAEEEFEDLIKKLNPEDDTYFREFAYIGIEDKTIEALEKYFDIEITSIHSDDCDYVGIWIIYK